MKLNVTTISNEIANRLYINCHIRIVYLLVGEKFKTDFSLQIRVLYTQIVHIYHQKLSSTYSKYRKLHLLHDMVVNAFNRNATYTIEVILCCSTVLDGL